MMNEKKMLKNDVKKRGFEKRIEKMKKKEKKRRNDKIEDKKKKEI